MKLLISNYLDEKPMFNQKLQNKLLWRIPQKELVELGWNFIDRTELTTMVDTGVEKFITNKFGEIPEIIMFWFQSEYNATVRRIIKALMRIQCDLFGYIDDLHENNNEERNSYINSIINGKYKGLFSSYAYCFHQYHQTKLYNVLWLPHAVPEHHGCPFNPNPEVKLLLTGVINEEVYPTRKIVYDMRLKLKGRIEALKHPGYKKPKHTVCADKYIKHMSNYLACFTCCSTEKTPYLVAKFFEIPLAGCLLLAYDRHVRKELKELGFRDGVNYIRVNENNIKDKIRYVLNPTHRAEIDKIRRKGYDLVRQRHLLKHRAEKIDELTEGLLL